LDATTTTKRWCAVATTTCNIENLGKTVEMMTRTAQESTRIMRHYVVQAQELNTKFARRAFETWIDASRRQTELGQTMVQRLYGEGRGPERAFQGLLNYWENAYTGFFFTPFGFYWEGLENAARNVIRMPAVVTHVATGDMVNGGLPIEDHDELNVGEMSGRLESLSEGELRMVRDYEKRNKNRDTLIEQFDRKIRANS
jgi:hypothetical protein